MNPKIVGIRFQRVGKIYHFDAASIPDVRIGDQVVVETSRGRQIGEVIQSVENPSPPPEGAWKSIQRKATPRDLVLRKLWQQKELEAMINCRARLAEIRVPGVKIAAAEYTFDGTRLSFLYATENEAKVDLRRLRSDMQRLYPRSQVEMRQIGPRDVAKLLGGMGACGLENRCCSMFLTDFSPISIKMAKEQGISLTPEEITGMCGRLRCCLVYEYEQYAEARKQLPKRNKRVISPKGEGKVWDVYPLKNTVVVELMDGLRQEFTAGELEPWDELEALRRKSQEPCDRHENGECDCGKDRSGADQAAESQTSTQGASEAIAPDDLQPGEEYIDLNNAPSAQSGPRPSRPAGHNQPGQGKGRSDRRKFKKKFDNNNPNQKS
jgi:cell fate regulator YaaT (PSP1 superfamily)